MKEPADVATPQEQLAHRENERISSVSSCGQPVIKRGEKLHLAARDVIAEGSRRLVFGYPGEPELLVKVPKPGAETKPDKPLKRLARQMFSDSKYRGTLKELSYENLLTLRLADHEQIVPIPRYLGLVETDLGPGMVVEAIRDMSGDLAPTLRRIAASGDLGPPIVAALNRFITTAFRWHIVVPDLHDGNLVYVQHDGGDRVLLIDGFGDRNIIPFRSLFKRMNDRSLHRRCETTAKRLNLTWMPQERQFIASRR